jgi:hypothetical protein
MSQTRYNKGGSTKESGEQRAGNAETRKVYPSARKWLAITHMCDKMTPYLPDLEKRASIWNKK